jgi:uncharacterized membrane protein YgdD (TMEM256/DUF423 family)
VDPAQGTISFSGGSVTFTPALNINLVFVPINYTVSDGKGGTSSAVLTVFVGPNNAPVGTNATLTTPEDTPLVLASANFGYTDVDPLQSLASVRIDTVPVNGTLQLNGLTVTAGQIITAADFAAGKVTFVSVLNANGTAYANFNFTVQDTVGAFATTPQTITVNVTPVNDAPVNTMPLPPSALEDTQIPITGVSVADIDSATLTTTVSVLHGTLSVASGTVATFGTITTNGTASVKIVGTATQINAALAGLKYTNTPDYNGSDTFQIVTTDAALTTTNTSNITITPVVDIANDNAVTLLNTAIPISVLANDSFENTGKLITAVNGAAITAGGAAMTVTNGTVALGSGATAGQLIFTPTTGFTGIVPTFTYTVTSGGVMETANVDVVVAAAALTPIIFVPASPSTAEDSPLAIAGVIVTSSDNGLQTATISVLHGTLSVTTGAVATFGTTTTNGTASVKIVGTGTQISAALAGLVYTSTADYNGSDTLSISSAEGLNISSQTLAITVTPVADIVNYTTTILEDTAITNFNLLATDNFDNAVKTITAVNGSSFAVNTPITVTGGTVSFTAAGLMTFTPTANYNGVATFTYTVTSGGGD